MVLGTSLHSSKYCNLSNEYHNLDLSGKLSAICAHCTINKICPAIRLKGFEPVCNI